METDEKEMLAQLKAMDDLRNCVKSLPLNKRDLSNLIDRIEKEISYVEYNIQTELGQKEMKRLREMK